ncbi:MAG: lactoylglutathione lyase [Pseudomonadota bacterium]|nr:lactoylglutathione lyase [Pseudomonadota bacterium]
MNKKPTEKEWKVVKATEPRIRHTMLRVKNLEKSIDFYTRLFGMTVFRQRDVEGGKYSVAFLGYGDENSDPAIELTYNWDQDDGYDVGDGYGHIAIGVPNIYALCDRLESEGVEIPRPAGPLKHGGPNASVIAFVKDPDGYLIELGERA